MQARQARAFTLIELLVVIAIIALLIGILLPALGRARDAGRLAKCLSGVRGMGIAMTLYAGEFNSFYPIIPLDSNDRNNLARGSPRPFLSGQGRRGGLAGFFSLNQTGDGINRGWLGASPDPDDPGEVYPDSQQLNKPGPEKPIMRGYLDSLEILTCPSDKVDYWIQGYASTIPASPTGSNVAIKIPKAPTKETDVVMYNISYLYIAGLKTDESAILTPAPIFGDETNGPDFSTSSWYGGGSTDLAAWRTANQSPARGFYGKLDNHNGEVAPFVFTDGHADTLKGNVHDRFFKAYDPGRPNEQPQPPSVNLVDRFRSFRVQTVD